MWQWKASRGGMLGRVDDQYIGPPRDVSADEAAYKARYQGGYWNDPGRAYYSLQLQGLRRRTIKGPVEVLAPAEGLEEDAGRSSASSISIRTAATTRTAPGASTINDTDPYTKEADAKIPVGTVMPGVLITGNYEGDRARSRRRLALEGRLLDA